VVGSAITDDRRSVWEARREVKQPRNQKLRNLRTREASKAAKVVKFVKSSQNELSCEDLRPIREIFVKSELGRLVVPGTRALGVRSPIMLSL
jgi:hypothetical protein